MATVNHYFGNTLSNQGFCRHGRLHHGISVFISHKGKQHVLHSVATFFNWFLVMCANIQVCLSIIYLATPDIVFFAKCGQAVVIPKCAKSSF